MSPPDNKLHLRRVEKPADVEELRKIRNECRAWMQNRAYINVFAQKTWWEAEPRVAYLAILDEKPVAFAHIQYLDGRNWITLGVMPEYRNKGIGRFIYGSFDKTHALIELDNVGSRKACEKAGYTACPEFSIPGWVILCNG